jgi:hypothetical protein
MAFVSPESRERVSPPFGRGNWSSGFGTALEGPRMIQDDGERGLSGSLGLSPADFALAGPVRPPRAVEIPLEERTRAKGRGWPLTGLGSQPAHPELVEGWSLNRPWRLSWASLGPKLVEGLGLILASPPALQPEPLFARQHAFPIACGVRQLRQRPPPRPLL